jgi:hypothetical protein
VHTTAATAAAAAATANVKQHMLYSTNSTCANKQQQPVLVNLQRKFFAAAIQRSMWES